jgi:vacuolar-type H+-ATPase subunit I/STV1
MSFLFLKHMANWYQNLTGRTIATVGQVLGLPEMGWSERATGSAQQTQPYLYGSRGGAYVDPNWKQPPAYTPPPPPKTLGVNTQQPTGNNYNVPSYSAPQNQDLIGNVNQSVNDYSQIINQDYENSMSALGNQESGLRGQADIAQQQIGNEFNQTQTQLGNEQAVGVQGVQGQVQTAETGAKSAMMNARDLFRQTQQSNIAAMSGLGISSSSVTESLAETLGIETARRIAGISGSLQEVKQNASKELSRIQTYYQERKTMLEQSKTLEISKIQQSLMSGLDNLNAARNTLAVDKAKQRYELLSNARNSIDAINQKAQDINQSLQSFLAQKAQAMTQIVSNPQYLANLQNSQAVMNQNFAPSGFSYVPNFDVNGKATGYTLRKKDLTGDTGTNTALDPSDPRNSPYQ